MKSCSYILFAGENRLIVTTGAKEWLGWVINWLQEYILTYGKDLEESFQSLGLFLWSDIINGQCDFWEETSWHLDSICGIHLLGDKGKSAQNTNYKSLPSFQQFEILRREKHSTLRRYCFWTLDKNRTDELAKKSIIIIHRLDTTKRGSLGLCYSETNNWQLLRINTLRSHSVYIELQYILSNALIVS